MVNLLRYATRFKLQLSVVTISVQFTYFTLFTKLSYCMAKKNTVVTLRDYKNTIDKDTNYRMCEVAKVANAFELALFAYRVTFFHCIVIFPISSSYYYKVCW